MADRQGSGPILIPFAICRGRKASRKKADDCPTGGWLARGGQRDAAVGQSQGQSPALPSPLKPRLWGWGALLWPVLEFHRAAGKGQTGDSPPAALSMPGPRGARQTLSPTTGNCVSFRGFYSKFHPAGLTTSQLFITTIHHTAPGSVPKNSTLGHT